MADDDDPLRRRRQQRARASYRRTVMIAVGAGVVLLVIGVTAAWQKAARDRPGPGEREVAGQVTAVTSASGQPPALMVMISNGRGWEGYCTFVGEGSGVASRLSVGDHVTIVGKEQLHLAAVTQLTDCRITSHRSR